MFDISTALAPALDLGALLHLPGSDGAPLYDADQNPIGVTMRGRNSRAGLAAVRENGNRRLAEMRRPGGRTATVEAGEAEVTELLVACTVGWNFGEMDGQPFPYTPGNARKLWSDDRFRRWRELAEEFVSADANFTKPSSNS